MTQADDISHLLAGDPFAWLVSQWFELHAAMPDYTMLRWVAEDDGALVGYAVAFPHPFATDGYGVATMFVAPAHRRRGTGSAFRELVRDGLRGRVPGVLYQHAEGAPDTTAVVAAWQLTESGRHLESVLDLTAYDRSRFERLADVDGITFGSHRSDLDDAGWARLHAFLTERHADAPDAGDGGEFLPLGAFRQIVAEPWMLATAEREGELVGITFVGRRPGSTTETNTWFTGVSPEARGLGLATALKAHQAIGMADAGIARLYTQNMDGNEPILRANARLGFTPAFRYVDVTEPID